MRNSNEKTTVIHGRDIKILSPAQELLKDNDSYIGNVQRMPVLTKLESKFEAKKAMPATTGPVSGVHQTSAVFTFFVEKCLYFSSKTGSR